MARLSRRGIVRRYCDGAIPNTVEVYRGPSAFDGAPIVVLVSGLVSNSANGKTGPMAQTWILRADIDPMAALRSGADGSVCGDCRHRPERDLRGRRWVALLEERACYVNVGQAPLALWRAWRRGSVPRLELERAAELLEELASFLGRRDDAAIRIGAYGDPAAVPMAGTFWRTLVGSLGHTGYTHAAHRSEGASLRGLCMASADSAAERDRFIDAGWATFRVAAPGERVSQARGEAHCPADRGPTQCASCPIRCDGSGLSVVIPAHGAGASNFTEGVRA